MNLFWFIEIKLLFYKYKNDLTLSKSALQKPRICLIAAIWWNELILKSRDSGVQYFESFTEISVNLMWTTWVDFDRCNASVYAKSQIPFFYVLFNSSITFIFIRIIHLGIDPIFLEYIYSSWASNYISRIIRIITPFMYNTLLWFIHMFKAICSYLYCKDRKAPEIYEQDN